MSIRTKMLLSMGFAIVAIVLSLHVVARGYLLDSFSTLSADLARENTHRAVSAIEGDVADLDADLRDNSAWDDAVTFVETRNEQFIHANLVPSAFRDMRIDLWACLANDGSIVWSGMYDREQGRIEPLSKEWTNVLRPGQALTFHHNQQSVVKGIIMMNHKPVLISSRPILTSDELGPVRGAMIIARRLDEDEVERVGRVIGVPFIADADDAENLRVLDASTWRILREPGSVSVAARGDLMEGKALLRDIAGEPAILIRTALPRRIEAVADYAISCFVLLLAAASGLIGAVAFYVQERAVIRRIAQLKRDLALAESSRGDTRITARGSDEVAGLAGGINALLDSLSEAAARQKDLADQLERRVQERTREVEDSRSEIRRLHQHVEGVREGERRMAAHRVHDEIGQSLTVLKVGIERLRAAAGGGTSAHAERLTDLAAQVDAITSTAQDIAMELRPSALDHLGLQAAVQWFAHRTQKRTGLACEVAAEDVPLDGEVATFAFRAIQELLTNVVRHSGATRAWIRVRRAAGGLRVEVEDNGKGMAPECVSAGHSFGLPEVRERALALGGTMEIERAAAGGARVALFIPLRNSAGDGEA